MALPKSGADLMTEIWGPNVGLRLFSAVRGNTELPPDAKLQQKGEISCGLRSSLGHPINPGRVSGESKNRKPQGDVTGPRSLLDKLHGPSLLTTVVTGQG